MATAAGPAGRYLIGTVLALVTNSLLRPVEDASPARYVGLESLRAFGRERLEEAGEAETTSGAHAAYFLDLAREAAPHLNGAEQGTWLDRLQTDHDNLRAGLDWALVAGAGETALEMVGTLWRFWSARGLLSEGRRWVEETIRRFDSEGGTGGSTRLPIAAGTLARAHGDYPAAETWFATALELARVGGDRGAEAAALNNLGGVALSQGDHRRAADLFGQSLEACRALGDRWREAAALSNLGAVAHYLGEIDKAEVSYEAALAIWEERGDRRRAALLMCNLVLLLAPLPERRDKARKMGERCLAESRALHFPSGIAAALTGLGLIAEGEGDLAKAAKCHEESAAVCRESEDRSGLARALGNLSLIIADLGDHRRAAALASESLQRFLALGDEEGVATSLEMLASVARASGEPRLATRLHGAAASRWAELAMPIPLALTHRHDSSTAALRVTLGTADLEADWELGKSLNVDDAVREADRLASAAAATSAG